MTGFTVELNQRHVDEIKLLFAGIKNGAETAMRIALNAGLDRAVSLSAKGISDKATITQSSAKEFFDTTRATNQNLGATLRLRGVSIPLIDFSNTQLTRGVSVKVWRDQPPVQYRHAFYATMPSGHRGIFERRESGTGFVGRLPIDELRGPPVTSIYEKTPGLSENVESDSTQRAVDELVRQVDRLLGTIA